MLQNAGRVHNFIAQSIKDPLVTNNSQKLANMSKPFTGVKTTR